MKNYVITLFAALLLCGCTHHAATSETAPELTLPETELTSESIMETEPAIQPDLSISVSAGSHCRRYTDETTRRYLDYYLFVPENMDRINQAGGNVEFVTIEDCKHGPASSKAFTIETFTWMLEQ